MQAAPEVVTRVWETAKELGYGKYFIPSVGQDVIDDHVPLLEKGLRVIDVIDIDYGPLELAGRAEPELSPHPAGHDRQDFGAVLQVVGTWR